MKTILDSLLLFSFVFLFSCGGRDDNLPDSADIVGSVSPYDDGTTQVDNSGMDVSVHGASFGIRVFPNLNETSADEVSFEVPS